MLWSSCAEWAKPAPHAQQMPSPPLTLQILYAEVGRCEVTPVSNSQLSCTIGTDGPPPTHIAAEFTVRVGDFGNALVAVSKDPDRRFVYLPAVTAAISPSAGSKAGGTLITVSGAGFADARVSLSDSLSVAFTLAFLLLLFAPFFSLCLYVCLPVSARMSVCLFLCLSPLMLSLSVSVSVCLTLSVLPSLSPPSVSFSFCLDACLAGCLLFLMCVSVDQSVFFVSSLFGRQQTISFKIQMHKLLKRNETPHINS